MHSFWPFPTVFPEQEPWRRSCRDLSGGDPHFCSVGTVQELLVLKSPYPVSVNLVSSGDESTPKLQLPNAGIPGRVCEAGLAAGSAGI